MGRLLRLHRQPVPQIRRHCGLLPAAIVRGVDAIYGDLEAELWGVCSRSHRVCHGLVCLGNGVGSLLGVVGGRVVNDPLRATRTPCEADDPPQEIVGPEYGATSIADVFGD